MVPTDATETRFVDVGAVFVTADADNDVEVTTEESVVMAATDVVVNGATPDCIVIVV